MHALRDRIDAAWERAVGTIGAGQAQEAVAELQALFPVMIKLRDDMLETKLFGLPREINPMLDEIDIELKIAASVARTNPSVDAFDSLAEALQTFRMELDSVRWQLIYNEPEPLP